MLPSVLLVTSQQEITVLAMCPDTPCFIPQGLVIAHVILLPEQDSFNTSESLVMWTRVISHSWPQLTCTLKLYSKKVVLSRLIDTGGDMMVISQSKWPLKWTLTPAPGTLSGIGGNSASLKSVQLVKFVGPKGHIANTRPFVVRPFIVL